MTSGSLDDAPRQAGARALASRQHGARSRGPKRAAGKARARRRPGVRRRWPRALETCCSVLAELFRALAALRLLQAEMADLSDAGGADRRLLAPRSALPATKRTRETVTAQRFRASTHGVKEAPAISTIMLEISPPSALGHPALSSHIMRQRATFSAACLGRIAAKSRDWAAKREPAVGVPGRYGIHEIIWRNSAPLVRI